MPSLLLAPDDDLNRELVAQVHPPDWCNPAPAGRYDLVVIGGGTAGLVAAAGAAGVGARVALVERHLLGGDCLNYGCVPSKALLSSARTAATVRAAGEFGVRVPAAPQVDFPAVMERLRRLRTEISRHDSAARFRSLGVDVYLGDARFTAEGVAVGPATLRCKRAAICTGARPALPALPGLQDVDCLTSETVFSLTSLPRRLAVIGGGPIGCELAQAFARCGSRVDLFHTGPRLLPRDDADAADRLTQAMRADGVTLHLQSHVERVTRAAAGVKLEFRSATAPTAAQEFDALLVAVGRTPNVEGLELEAAGVRYNERGVEVNDFLQTTNPRIYAAGDVCSADKFTHAADFQARIVVQNALFFGRARVSRLLIPWCTYTTPEVAHVGLLPEQAARQGVPVDTFVQELTGVDRAVLDGQAQGFVKLHVRKGTDRIVGATIVAEHAGELISEITLAMRSGLGLKDIAATIHPYPTQADAIRKLGDQFNRTRLTPFARRLLRFILTLRR